MKIRLLCVGKIKEKWLKLAIDEYKKRLSRFVTVEILEFQDYPDSMGDDIVKEKEAQAILSHISITDHVIAFDVLGEPLDSIQFSKKLMDAFVIGGSQIIMLIGGSRGFSSSVYERVQQRISLSLLTFPHQMSRVIVLEQIFRAFKIANNEKYHK